MNMLPPAMSMRRVHENTKVGELLRQHLTLQPGEALKHHQLREYVEAGAQDRLAVVMRKERTPVRVCPNHRCWGTGFDMEASSYVWLLPSSFHFLCNVLNRHAVKLPSLSWPWGL